jgi:hypothetical protein
VSKLGYLSAGVRVSEPACLSVRSPGVRVFFRQAGAALGALALTVAAYAGPIEWWPLRNVANLLIGVTVARAVQVRPPSDPLLTPS